MSTPPPIPKTHPNKGKRRERCQNPNRVRNIRKKEWRKRRKTQNRARGNNW